MSLAPASMRGFFLNARFAVNGIQCAARSFGTLTLVGVGLLSSMAGLFGFGWFWGVGLPVNLSVLRCVGNAGGRDISAQAGRAFTSEVGAGSHSNQVYADCVDLPAVENASNI